MDDQINPFAPDAPILHLLSLRDNPLLATATEEQLIALVKRLRTTAQQPATLKAEVARTTRTTVASKKKSLLDSI